MTQEEAAQQIHVLIHSPLLQKQRYLISSRAKAKVSHIMLFPCLFLYLCYYSHGKVKEAISRHLESIWTLFPGCLPSFAELSSNPLQYELERLNKETDKRRKLRPSGETKGSLLPSSRVAQRKINDGAAQFKSKPVESQRSKPQCNYQGEDGIYTL